MWWVRLHLGRARPESVNVQLAGGAARPGKAIAAGLTKSTHETGEWIGTNAGHRGADNGRLFPVSHEQAQCTNRCCGSRNSLAAPGNRSHRPTIRNGIGQRQCRHLFKFHGGNARDSHPLVVAGMGATSGWGSLLGIASSLIGAIGSAAKKSQ
jgi:hypothetical protein